MGGSAVPAGVIAAAVAAAGDWLRLADGEGQAALAPLAATAIGIAEAYLGQALVARGFEDVLAVGGGWQALEAVPVTAIAGLTALPIGAAPFVLPVDTYAIDIDADARGWVRVGAPVAASRVAVSYTAGVAASWEALPPPVAQGVLLLIAHLYENRASEAAPPAAVAALWRPFRRLTLAVERRL